MSELADAANINSKSTFENKALKARIQTIIIISIIIFAKPLPLIVILIDILIYLFI